MGRDFRVDCHIHSGHSPDGKGTVSQIIAAAKERGLDGVAITDHNTIRAHRDIKALKDPGLLVIPGIEISTADGHCLGLGVGQAVRAGLSLEDTIDKVEAAGGVAVPSHSLRRIHGVGAKVVKRCADRLVAIEVYNGHDGDRKSQQAELLAIHNGLGGTGGSDSHRPQNVGHAYTTFPVAVETVDEALELIRKRKTWGTGIPFKRRSLLRKNAVSFSHWVRRGFRPI
jgi:predicted metal-dependent phosphoesterase TrpH